MVVVVREEIADGDGGRFSLTMDEVIVGETALVEFTLEGFVGGGSFGESGVVG